MRGKRIVLLLSLFMLTFVAFSMPNTYTPQTTTLPPNPQGAFSPPSNQTGNGYLMNLTESVNCFNPDTLNTTNSFSSNYVKPHNDSFMVQTPTNYGTIWQNITITNIVAETDFIAVQDGFGASGLKCGSQGLANGHYRILAINFTVSQRVNLTSVWLRYGAFQDLGAQDPPVIPLNIETDSASHVPSGTTLGSGNLQNNIGAGWHEVQVRTSGNPVTLDSGTVYWLVINGSSIPGVNDGYYVWYYVSDPTSPSYDGKCVAAYTGAWLLENPNFSAINLLSVLVVKAVDGSLATKVYSSPADVQMRLNGTLISGSTMSVNPSKRFFNFTTVYSVSFTATWIARFEHLRLGSVSTHYIALEGFTLWNATFTSDGKPSNLYTWYNKTFKVATIPQFWSRNSPPTNITNDLGFSSLFVGASTYYIVNQTSGLDALSWDTGWTIATKSSYKVTASLPSQVVAGLPLILDLSTDIYMGTWCNVTFYNAVDYPSYSRNITIQSNSLSLPVKLNVSGVYTLFLFNRLTGGNEASLNRTLTVNVLEPLCNVTVNSINSPILGNPATATFRFRNGTAGGASMSPISVKINGTDTTPSYAGGVTTVSWSTALGNWRSGLNYVNITAISGVFFNSTIYPITILPPNAKLLLNATSYSATYGDGVPIRLTFLNLTGGGTPFPSAPTLYRNGSSVSPITDLGGGSYVYVLNTRSFAQAGSYHLNFTAKYGTYIATNITSFTLNKLVMTISLHLDQTSVTAGSSLSASATLGYPNGTAVEDLTNVVFRFTVTYANGTVGASDEGALTQNGVATSALTTNGNMTKITVEAIYGGDGIRTSASDVILDIPVTPPTSGFPVIVVAGVAGTAVIAALIPIAVRARRKKGREEEHRKTAVLRQTASLAQLVVVDLRSGRCAFSRSLGSEENVDPHLISGFLSANQSILGEVFKNKSKAGLRFADYGDYKVISHVGNYIMATLFATETAGEELKSVLEKFTDKFEQKYGRALQSWDGNMNTFKDAEEITDEVFALQLTSPYMLLEVPSAKLNKNERAALHFARILSAERGVFFMPRVVDYLLTKQGLKRGQAMDAINSLTKKGIIRQLTIEQAAQVVQSTLGKSESQS